MSERILLRIGRKGAIYLPRKVMRKLGLNEGDYLLLRIKDNRIIIDIIPDPFLLAVKSKKWAKTTVEEFEKESEQIQEEILSENTS